ncbi:MAG: DUF4019 domain-containing protein [Verrucomicrobia bacterium]|nr:DUF4019 domain-containing protein [Verrucomicrobiota bacterium]
MNKFIVPLLFVVSLCLPHGGALGVEARPEDAAQPAAAEWLALVDAGRFVESWEKMSPGFKKKISKRKWKSTVEEIRKPLGKFTTRKLKSAEYSKELPGAPEGEYVILRYDAAFERKPAAVEKTTLILGEDLNWRVSSYAVK